MQLYHYQITDIGYRVVAYSCILITRQLYLNLEILGTDLGGTRTDEQLR